MTTAHLPKATANEHGAWSALVMVAALLLSVLLLVMTGLDRPAETNPVPFPQAPAVQAELADTERATEPVPAPAPQPGPIR